MNVLFVTYGLPYPPDRGPRIRDSFLIKSVSRRHDVLLLSLLDSPEQMRYLSQMERHCRLVDAIVARPRSPAEHIRGVLRGVLSGRPPATHPFFYEEMAAKIREVTTRRNVDIVQIEHSFLAPYVDALPRGSKCKAVLDFHNVGLGQYRRMIGLNTRPAQKLGFVLKWLLMLGWESAYAQRFDHCLVVSQQERELLQTSRPNLPISVIENGVDTTVCKPLPEASVGNVLLLVGTIGYPPNRDAVLYFCQRILPLIQRRIPDVKLYVVGHAPTSEIQGLAVRKNVVVTGSVPDIVPYYQQARLTVVPLRGGGGTRLKILESMAFGRPVVSTSLGCEGLAVVDGEHVMIADSPSEFAERVIQLLEDRGLRAQICENAVQLVQTRYDWSIISQKLMDVYAALLDQADVKGAESSQKRP